MPAERGGRPLPPWDGRSTLDRLGGVLRRDRPRLEAMSESVPRSSGFAAITTRSRWRAFPGARSRHGSGPVPILPCFDSGGRRRAMRTLSPESQHHDPRRAAGVWCLQGRARRARSCDPVALSARSAGFPARPRAALSVQLCGGWPPTDEDGRVGGDFDLTALFNSASRSPTTASDRRLGASAGVVMVSTGWLELRASRCNVTFVSRTAEGGT